MDYKEFNDDELLDLISENNEDAKDILYEKYAYIINYCVKDYRKTGFTLGIDYKDLYQEAMLGFADALNSYQNNKDASLPTFINLCVKRRLKSFLIKAGRDKNKIIQESLSLDYSYDGYTSTLADFLSDNGENNPLFKLTKKEDYKYLLDKIELELTTKEKEVFDLLITGLSCSEISNILDINIKSTYNSIQRIKEKTRKILKARENE